jgi:hypothetical protein
MGKLGRSMLLLDREFAAIEAKLVFAIQDEVGEG